MSGTIYRNPFSAAESDRYQLWEMLVERDIRAFVQQDWSLVADDFLAGEFVGVSGHFKSNPDSWTLAFPTLDVYRQEWLLWAERFASTPWAGNAEQELHDATNLRDIEIQGDVALLHKKFDGRIVAAKGDDMVLDFQTLYRCRQVQKKWKIIGFTGYLPLPMGTGRNPTGSAKQVPKGASQHITAGPYSPVLEIDASRLIVISGQAAIDPEGQVLGDDIETQTRVTLKNCRQQLESAGCTLADVFKVNVFMTDLADWPRFNEVYKSIMPDPKPVRTAVQSGLLMNLVVEIEMWAAKK